MTPDNRDERLDPALKAALLRVVGDGSTIPTVDRGLPNEVVEIADDGVVIETERSRSREGPKLVPAWMFNLGWRRLVETGELSNPEFSAEVHRSSAVFALLSQLPEVEIVSTRPIRLRCSGQGPTS